MADPGFWVGMGAPSIVDWCEPNYVFTSYVAELFNTLSSTPMVALGSFGLMRWPETEARFKTCFWGLILVGLGSVGFHGTLLRGPQAADELPMVYMGLVGAWILLHRSKPAGEGRGLAVGMAVFSLVFTVAYWTVASYFTLFILLYAGTVAYVTIASFKYTLMEERVPARTRMFWGAAGCYLGGLTLFWLPEHLLLGCDHWLQGLQLHSLWHFGAGAGTFCWTLWAMADRAHATGAPRPHVAHAA